MLDSDLESFQSMLDSVCGLISRGRYTPSAEAAALFFNAMKAYDLGTVSAAFSAHVKDTERGKYAPTPSDLIAQIQAAMTDVRPGAEQAWAMIPAGEEDTIVWTAEMAEAHAACAPLLADGDKIAARMTFKEVYTKAVMRAVAAGEPVQWSASLGWDMEKRKRALMAAVKEGKLPALAAREECPALPLTRADKALPAPDALRRENYQQSVTALAKNLTKAEPADPKAWARELKRRDEAGDELTIKQRDDYKRALRYATDDRSLFGGFEPIPDHVLPPGMRKGGDCRPREDA